MEFELTSLPGIILIKPRLFRDKRGFFFESWQQKTFSTAGISVSFVQDNHSRSTRHVLRGLHYQVRQPQGKLVRVVYGAVFDVAVDVRRSSPTFGKWVGFELNDENHQMLWIPPGFAHGYLTLSERADLLYKCTDMYAACHERSILWSDAEIGVKWPLPLNITPLLSDKDAAAGRLDETECFT